MSAPTVSLHCQSKMSAVVTLTGPMVSSSNSGVGLDGMDEDLTLTGATSVPVTKTVEYEVALVAGVKTIDLTALPGLTDEETVNGTGLKVQSIKLKNKVGNANLMTFTKGASSGYGLGASGAAWTMPLSPGQSMLLLGAEANPDVAGGAKTIDVAGTGTQTIQIAIGLG